MQDEENLSFISNNNAVSYVKDMQKSLRTEMSRDSQNKHGQKLNLVTMNLSQ